MTPRQKEFARNYANGMPAPKAAIASGYAASTAERNAAAFLCHPRIQERIASLRARKCTISMDDLIIARDTILHVLESPKATVAEKLKAAEVLCRLAKTQTRLEIDTFSNLKEQVLEAQYAAANLEYAYEDQKQLDITEERLHEIEAETTDHEGVTHDEAYAQGPPEHDFTEDGRLAFDEPKRILFEGSSPRTKISQGSSLASVPETDAHSPEQSHLSSLSPRPWDCLHQPNTHKKAPMQRIEALSSSGDES